MDESNTYNWFSGYISFFIHRRSSSDSENKERNIISKPVVSVWVIHFSSRNMWKVFVEGGGVFVDGG